MTDQPPTISKHHDWWAFALIALVAAVLVWLGMKLLWMPPIYKLAQARYPLLRYEGQALIALAIILICAHRWAVDKLRWVGQEMHRIASGLLVAGALGIDAAMHAFAIPHVEGWWLPLVGSSALISGAAAWIKSWRK